jgi:hypothetical protein
MSFVIIGIPMSSKNKSKYFRLQKNEVVSVVLHGISMIRSIKNIWKLVSHHYFFIISPFSYVSIKQFEWKNLINFFYQCYLLFYFFFFFFYDKKRYETKDEKSFSCSSTFNMASFDSGDS